MRKEDSGVKRPIRLQSFLLVLNIDFIFGKNNKAELLSGIDDVWKKPGAPL